MTDPLVRVGRWMGQQEYDAMCLQQKVIENETGTVHVAFPADRNAFYRQAAVGSLYVEFDVPISSVKQTTEIWAKILGPNTTEGRLARSKGMADLELPSVRNVQLVTRKTK